MTLTRDFTETVMEQVHHDAKALLAEISNSLPDSESPGTRVVMNK